MRNPAAYYIAEYRQKSLWEMGEGVPLPKFVYMYIEQIYTNCLAEASYYVESDGEALVIDPIREPEPYLLKAKERGARIKYVLETHFHADFVSGHVDLAEKSGAEIVFGPGAQTGFDAYIAVDGEELALGKLKIRVLHTPGHTGESTCYLLLDENGNENAVFSGDTLFIGDVGRPDLAVKSDLTTQDLAGMLFDSLRNKIMTLPDSVTVYPAHGAGSACGKNISSETFSTIGNQKQTNYALQDMPREQFIKVVTEGIMPAPEYFGIAAGINKNGADELETVYEKALTTLSADQAEQLIAEGALVLDTRSPDEFEIGFIPDSINIGLNGQFAIWAATVLNYNTPLILITEPGKEKEAIQRLARVGLDKISGFLGGGFDAWKNAGKPVDTIESINPEEFISRKENGASILDVRKPGEFEASHIQGAKFITLQDLEQRIAEVPTINPVLLHCAGGYRSMIAASMLKRKGYQNIINVRKGFGGLKSLEGLPLEEGPCPSQKLKAAAGML